MAYSLATGYADDGQRVKLSYIKWPTGTSASFTLIDPAPNRGGRFVVFALYGVEGLTVAKQAQGYTTATLSAGGTRSVNLVGSAGNGYLSLTSGTYSAISAAGTERAGVTLTAASSNTYSGGNGLVAAAQFSVS